MRPDQPLRVAYLVYRGNPHCGGQGVYTRHLARELTALGHQVEVFSGQPYPELDDPSQLTEGAQPRPLPAREPVPGAVAVGVQDPHRPPRVRHHVRGRLPRAVHVQPAGARLLRNRRADFDVVHDNQCLGTGLLGMMDDGWPVLATLHHPITVDRDLDLAHANAWRRFTLRRWYGFLDMQMRVARAIPRVVTVSESSGATSSTRWTSSRTGCTSSRSASTRRSSARCPTSRRVPGGIMTTASADVPMKGLAPLLEALAKVRTERDDADLVVIGKPEGQEHDPRRSSTGSASTALSGSCRRVTTERIVELYAEAEVAVVPSLYEGFSLPAVEAMACGVPLVATTGRRAPRGGRPRRRDRPPGAAG